MFNRKSNALIQSIVWFTIMITVTVLFFSGDNVLDWVDNTIGKVISSVLIGVGFIMHLYSLIVIDRRDPLDERVICIREKATSTTFIVSMVYVFAIAMYLYTRYETASYIAVPWLWYIAYSTVFVTFMVANLSYFIIDNKDIGYED